MKTGPILSVKNWPPPFFRSGLDLAVIYLNEQSNHEAEKLLLKLFTMNPYNEEACLLLLKLYFSEVFCLTCEGI